MAHDHDHKAPNRADVEAAHATDITETIVPYMPVVGGLMMLLLAFIAVSMA